MFFGYFIGKFPLVFLIGTFVLLAPLLSFFLIYPVSIETDVRRGFSHRNGRSTQEFKVWNFSNLNKLILSFRHLENFTMFQWKVKVVCEFWCKRVFRYGATCYFDWIKRWRCISSSSKCKITQRGLIFKRDYLFVMYLGWKAWQIYQWLMGTNSKWSKFNFQRVAIRYL